MMLGPSYRILRAAWIMARAFTPHPVFAVLSFPWTLVSVIPGTLRGGLYLDSTRTGMVMLYRSRMLLDILIVTPVMILYFLAAAGVIGALGELIPYAGVFLVTWGVLMILAIVGFVFLLPRGGGSMLPWGPETPHGQRWEVAGLAQMPGTRFTAIQLALRVINEVPPAGAVIIAIANSATMLHQYQRLGFTAGPEHRVHKVVQEQHERPPRSVSSDDHPRTRPSAAP